MSNIEKYLSAYAEPEARLAATVLSSSGRHLRWEYALVIPAYRETPKFFHRLTAQHLSAHKVLLILVINQPNNEIEPHALNARLFKDIKQQSEILATNDNLCLLQIPNTGSAILLVDKFSAEHRIPRKQGVGLARKIGADIAMQLIAQAQVSCPWIFSTDADTQLPNDYFSAVTSATGKAGAIYPFRHHCPPGRLGDATRLYEASINHYVSGLAYAGSPYAFHTLGSSLAMDYRAYANARGFPKRAGGEDFYLLNKLAKLGGLHQLDGPILEIEARHSDRVPFGTGPAVARLLNSQVLEDVPLFYDPEIFEALKQWLSCVPRLFPDYQLPPELDNSCRQILHNLGVDTMLAHANRQCKTPAQSERQFHTWFDGFRTLRFIHGLRDAGRPNLSLSDLRKTMKNQSKESPFHACNSFLQGLPDLVSDRHTGSG